jgi:hypothetical protein
MTSSGLLRRVALVRTAVSEELSASIIRVTRIGELGTTLAVTSSRRTLRASVRQLGHERLVSPRRSLRHTSAAVTYSAPLNKRFP